MTDHRKIPVTQASGATVNLYAKRQAIHPRAVTGIFQKVRDLMVWLTMGAYFLLPWLRWNDSQAILFDLPARQFHIFGITFWPQDFSLLAGLLILLAFGLFLITVWAGRVYCGYVCPQTTWTKFFVWIEELTEGSRSQRIKLDAAPWHMQKILRRGARHFLWLLMALLTGVTFVGYFMPMPDLVLRLLTLQLGSWEMIWILFFTVMTYLNAGWLREQVCIYMCPYARFQSVMFDADTLIVSYDEKRGEPRSRGVKSRDNSAAGDCIDCDLCVQVCPTGIDIRDGLQYECITCAACIDACDNVMEQIGKPKGLIRYTTENALAGKPTRMLRPRLMGYAAVLLAMLMVFIAAIWLRTPLGVDVMRDRGQLYRTLPSGEIENAYRLELMNMSQHDRWFVLELDGPEGLSMDAPQRHYIAAGEHATVPVTLRYDPYFHEIQSGTIWFSLKAEDDETLSQRRESRFIAPQ